jgi:hypothetical protein
VSNLKCNTFVKNFESMKNTKQITYAALAGATALALGSCGKYEDGPGFSLLSKKSRVAGDWDTKTIDGYSLAGTGYSYTFSFDKDGAAKLTYSDGYDTYTYTGTWDFASDKEELALTFYGYTLNYDIKRLTNTEMWLDDDATDAVGQEWKLEAM